MCLPVHPFKVEREWEHAGLKCAVVQAREVQHRCAYVRVPPGHPLHGRPYDEAANLEVHGGITFSEEEPCVEEDGKGWWFGFDFAHYGDAMYDPNPDPSTLSDEVKEFLKTMNDVRANVGLDMRVMFGSYTRPTEHYWTQAEVEHECEDLAEQLAALR
jgi:hypothetical protein